MINPIGKKPDLTKFYQKRKRDRPLKPTTLQIQLNLMKGIREVILAEGQYIYHDVLLSFFLLKAYNKKFGTKFTTAKLNTVLRKMGYTYPKGNKRVYLHNKDYVIMVNDPTLTTAEAKKLLVQRSKDYLNHLRTCSNPDCTEENPQPRSNFYRGKNQCKTCRKVWQRNYQRNMRAEHETVNILTLEKGLPFLQCNNCVEHVEMNQCNVVNGSEDITVCGVYQEWLRTGIHPLSYYPEFN